MQTNLAFELRYSSSYREKLLPEYILQLRYNIKVSSLVLYEFN